MRRSKNHLLLVWAHLSTDLSVLRPPLLLRRCIHFIQGAGLTTIMREERRRIRSSSNTTTTNDNKQRPPPHASSACSSSSSSSSRRRSIVPIMAVVSVSYLLATTPILLQWCRIKSLTTSTNDKRYVSLSRSPWSFFSKTAVSYY